MTVRGAVLHDSEKDSYCGGDDFIHEKVLFHGESRIFVRFVHREDGFDGEVAGEMLFVHQKGGFDGETMDFGGFVHGKGLFRRGKRDCRSGRQ